MTVQQIQKKEYETHLDIREHIGINTFGEHSELFPGEMRECEDYEITSSGHLKSRSGSQFLKAASSPTKRGSTDIVEGVTWDIGAEEYVITQEGTSFYSQALLTPADPVLIAHVVTGGFTVSSTAQADMFLNGDKLFIFHTGGNKIIEWSGSVFTGRSMGLSYPVLLAVATSGAGNITGKYTWGVEKVYQVSNIDKVASTPNRYTSGRLINALGTITAKKVLLTIQDAELDNDNLWTHIRLWRSVNQDTNYDNVEQVVDAAGVNDELYEVALITKAEIEAGSLTAIATGTSLPVGNANVTAGNPGSVYSITDNCLDEELGGLHDIQRIELIPLPAANTGAYHRNRIYVSDVNDATLDDDSGDNIYYSNWAGTPYAEMYDVDQFVKTNRDGQKILKLISFEKDLFGLKEGKTGRLQDGNPNLEFEVLDHRTGIKHKNMAAHIPGIGICAVTTDHGDFKVMGFDHVWSNTINGIEISKNLRTQTVALTGANVSIIYLNGKIMLSDGAANVWVLNVEQRRGWSKFTYATNSLSQLLVTFGNESRGAIVNKSTHVVEIEISTIDTDINTSTDLSEVIEPFHTTHKYSVEDGSFLMEFDYYVLMGAFQYPVYGIPYVNGLAWPLKVSETETEFVSSPDVNFENAELRDKEYRLYIKPSTVGDFVSQVPVGNFLHYKIKTTAPSTIKTNKQFCVVDEEPGWGDFDPFRTNYGLTLPAWASNYILYLKFINDLTVERDYSVNRADFTYDGGSGGTRTYDTNLIPDAGMQLAKAAGSGYSIVTAANLTISDKGIGQGTGGLCSKNLSFIIEDTFPDVSVAETVIDEDGDGTNYYRFKVLTDGSIEFRWADGVTYDKSFTTAASVVTQGTAAQYATLSQMIIFVLTNEGQNGQFYHGLITDSGITAITTTAVDN